MLAWGRAMGAGKLTGGDRLHGEFVASQENSFSRPKAWPHTSPAHRAGFVKGMIEKD